MEVLLHLHFKIILEFLFSPVPLLFVDISFFEVFEFNSIFFRALWYFPCLARIILPISKVFLKTFFYCLIVDIVLFWVQEWLISLELLFNHPLKNTIVWEHSFELLKLVTKLVLVLWLCVVWSLLYNDCFFRCVIFLETLRFITLSKNFFKYFLFLFIFFLLVGYYPLLFLKFVFLKHILLVGVTHVLILWHLISWLESDLDELFLFLICEIDNLGM
jgi:hypothetical protein